MSGVMIVTGASRGIGAATAVLAGRRGYAVCVNYNRSGERAAQVVSEITSHGGRALAMQADVAREDDVVRLFATVDAKLGPVTALVNNAGTTGGASSVDRVEASALRAMMDLNVIGAFICAREAVRRMSTAHGGAGGAIVNVSSRAAAIGGAGEWVHYAASKGAIDTMTRGLSVELAPQGIRVNAVSPGLIDTEIHASGAPGRLEKMKASIPAGRIGTAEEVAQAIMWLFSDEAAYVTGTLLAVAGGR